MLSPTASKPGTVRGSKSSVHNHTCSIKTPRQRSRVVNSNEAERALRALKVMNPLEVQRKQNMSSPLHQLSNCRESSGQTAAELLKHELNRNSTTARSKAYLRNVQMLHEIKNRLPISTTLATTTNGSSKAHHVFSAAKIESEEAVLASQQQ